MTRKIGPGALSALEGTFDFESGRFQRFDDHLAGAGHGEGFSRAKNNVLSWVAGC